MAICVGGGPAPGINSVIGAATIRAGLAGVSVLGVRDGFQWLMKGDIEKVRPLTIQSVSRIHFRGGSIIGISRSNPTKDDKDLESTVISLLRLNVDQLITIGGDAGPNVRSRSLVSHFQDLVSARPARRQHFYFVTLLFPYQGASDR